MLLYHHIELPPLCVLIARMKISDISSIYRISIINDTISTINNRLRKKSIKSLIYRYLTDILMDISIMRHTRGWKNFESKYR